ncbi:MAG: hypothetical protein JXR53_13385 [Bacteroidales bacterium]|nr:hypothetical protein [Bacteroidales bacterium]
MRSIVLIFLVLTISTRAQNDNMTTIPGEIPFSFPIVKECKAVDGEFVLSPSRAFLDDAFAKDGKAIMIWYQNLMAKTDTNESTIKQISGEVQIPNSLIIPIPAGATAKKGDFILTTWQSGSGMQRAIVVDDNDPSAPIVHYLDLSWDNPAKNKDGIPIGQMREPNKPNTFTLLNEDWQAGSSIAIKNGTQFSLGILISKSEDKVLYLKSAMLNVADSSQCFLIDYPEKLKEGDQVFAPMYGTYKPGKVVKYDEEMGRVWVDVEFAGSTKEVVISVLDVLMTLPE